MEKHREEEEAESEVSLNYETDLNENLVLVGDLLIREINQLRFQKASEKPEGSNGEGGSEEGGSVQARSVVSYYNPS